VRLKLDAGEPRIAARVSGDVAIDAGFAGGDFLRTELVEMNVGKADVAVPLEADAIFRLHLAVDRVLRIEHAVVEDLGERSADDLREDLAVATARMFAAAGKVVVVDVGVFGIRIVVLIVDRVAGKDVADHLQAAGLVVGDLVLENLDVVHRQEQHARARRYVGDAGARRPEVRMVVLGHLVVEHADAAAVVDRQPRQVEDQDAAAVVGGVVVEDVGVERVLDLDAGHVLVHVAVLDHDTARLADVNAGVGCPTDLAAVDQHILTRHGVDAIGAVGGFRLARPGRADVAEGDVLRADDLDRVAPRVLDRQVFDDEVVARRLDPLRAHGLVLEGEDRLIPAGPADGDVVRGDFEIHVEVEGARRQLDHVSRARLDQTRQKFALRIGARLDRVHRGVGRRRAIAVRAEIGPIRRHRQQAHERDEDQNRYAD